MRGTVLSISVLAVAAGIALAEADVISISAGDSGLVELIELALILTLLADGLIVERELLRIHWGPPARAIALAFARSKMPTAQTAFIAWFGPKGVASMLFALFVLNSQTAERTVVFDVAAFVILASIVAHGLTDTVGARWIERRVAEERS